MRIFSARRSAWSTSTTRRPRWPATAAVIMPAAPAPITATSKSASAMRWRASVFFQAVDVIPLFAIGSDVAGQAVNIGFEARELVIELTGELEVVDDTLIEALAGNQQRNARRIRREQHAGDSSFELLDIDAFGLAVRHLGIGVRWLHGRHHVAEIDLGGQARQIVFAIGLVDLLAQVAQAHFFVAAMLFAEIGQDAPHGLVAIVVVLE